MSLLRQYEFANPLWFFALLLLPVIAAWYYRTYRQHYAPVQWSNLTMLRNYQSLRGRLRVLLPTLRTLAFVSIVIALARPQNLLELRDESADGIDIMLAMDVSSSMLAKDFEPDRLTVSKQMAIEFVAQRPTDRLGLVVFAAEAFTQCPLTTDHAVVNEFLENLTCGYLEDGTAIGMGLATAVSRIKQSKAKSKVIILLTDGVNNAGYFQPITAADIAAQFGVRVYTIGVGQDGLALAPTSRFSNGEYLFDLTPVQIDEQLLTDIAKRTGGKYYRAKSSAALRQIYQQIDQLEKSKTDIETIRRRTDVFGIFALVAIALIALELLLRYTIFRTIP